MKLITCPYHNDKTASMKIYGTVAFCFACHLSVATSVLNLPGEIKYTKPEPTDIKEKMEYIKSLKIGFIRGLQLPYDDEGYYIVYPTNNYYKKRLDTGKSRYVAPTGHKTPLYVTPGDSPLLAVIEGELNAASAYHVEWDKYKVCSPGSAGEFLKHIDYYRKFKRITLFLDYDAPGIVHGYQTKEVLLKHGCHVNLVLLKKDFNEMLQEGEQVLKQFLEENY